MSDICKTPFGTWAPTYRKLGLWPRPVRPHEKACKEKGWTTPDHELPSGTIEQWDKKYPHYNIGLLMGTPLPDGTRLGALDVDHDLYLPLARTLLRCPPCGRIGKKGGVYFVRFTPLKAKAYKVAGEGNEHLGQVAEWLVDKRNCVIPPSIHPDTDQPYRWDGTPLHEIDFNQLPLIGE